MLSNLRCVIEPALFLIVIGLGIAFVATQFCLPDSKIEVVIGAFLAVAGVFMLVIAAITDRMSRRKKVE